MVARPAESRPRRAGFAPLSSVKTRVTVAVRSSGRCSSTTPRMLTREDIILPPRSANGAALRLSDRPPECLPFSVEIKNQQRLHKFWEWWAQADRNATPDCPPLLAFKRHRGGWFVLCRRRGVPAAAAAPDRAALNWVHIGGSGASTPKVAVQNLPCPRWPRCPRTFTPSCISVSIEIHPGKDHGDTSNTRDSRREGEHLAGCRSAARAGPVKRLSGHSVALPTDRSTAAALSVPFPSQSL
jgi:hypothetical protein